MTHPHPPARPYSSLTMTRPASSATAVYAHPQTQIHAFVHEHLPPNVANPRHTVDLRRPWVPSPELRDTSDDFGEREYHATRGGSTYPAQRVHGVRDHDQSEVAERERERERSTRDRSSGSRPYRGEEPPQTQTWTQNRQRSSASASGAGFASASAASTSGRTHPGDEPPSFTHPWARLGPGTGGTGGTRTDSAVTDIGTSTRPSRTSSTMPRLQARDDRTRGRENCNLRERPERERARPVSWLKRLFSHSTCTFRSRSRLMPFPFLFSWRRRQVAYAICIWKVGKASLHQLALSTCG